MITPNIENNINANANKKPQRNAFGTFIWYASFILLLPVFLHIGNINSLRRINVKVSEAESGIDVQLKRRRDTLLKLIDAVKGSIKFEKEALTTVTAMRTGMGIEGMIKSQKAMDTLQKGINIQMENYPDLKSTQSIRELMSAAADIEEDIAAQRRIYNQNVGTFNQEIQVYPKNQAAAALKYVSKYFFEITEAEREDVVINFE
ncbi:LemA family protein [Spiroplasma gladiatoris]|uniref:LemA family protein n=1 Tax=Spiroplasma gladiatoris TaxID=2143 RepID=A0A4P7AH31_9MOLU|nr:LemA family protein [Spiroplasma gladiatoris]QBQ07467.1 LemA family protein [Spiroplasma gladiatoris]